MNASSSPSASASSVASDGHAALGAGARRAGRGPRPRELFLLVSAAALVAAWLAAPALPPPAREAAAPAWALATDAGGHLAFFLIGAWGLLRLTRLERHVHAWSRVGPAAPAAPAAAVRDCAWLLFAGLLATAAASLLFAAMPADMRQAADRAGTSIAFAGLLGVAVCERVSLRAGWIAAWCAIAAGLFAAGAACVAGDRMPWLLLQAAGVAIVAVLAMLPPTDCACGLRLVPVLLFIALARLLDAADPWLVEGALGLVPGHAARHLVGALAALPVLRSLGTAVRRPARRPSPRLGAA